MWGWNCPLTLNYIRYATRLSQSRIMEIFFRELLLCTLIS